MKREELLLTKLMEYGKSDIAPFHMPGHKRQLGEQVTGAFPNPFSIDITEIEGFDNLHHAEGVLKDSMDWAAGVYGADRSWYLVNGSSSGILSAVFAAVSRNGRILMSRNCHKSAYHGVILKNLRAEYIYPQIIPELGIQGGILPEDVEKQLERFPDTEAALIVSPTYDGMVSDVKAIAETVHRHGIPLIVDEAHGAHFSFGNGVFPVSALLCGADLVIQSLHKTLPSFTQTAMIHMRRGLIQEERLEQYLQMFQSSSPSYVFMAGMESCIFEMESRGKQWMEVFGGRLRTVRRKLEALKQLRVLGAEQAGKHGIYAVDLSKLIISCRGCFRQEDGRAVTGETLGSWLREEFHLEMEMCGVDYTTAILTVMDSQESLDRLVCGLLSIDSRLRRAELQDQTELQSLPVPKICMRPGEAAEAGRCVLPLKRCAGRISTEFIYLYPPGIPIAAPGEQVTEGIIALMEQYKAMGLPVQGMADKTASSLAVAEEDF
ncbi:MAG: PLP-dependent transferase [Eubacteriales bacterium]|nr:PLP-dependent transferase [Eubacteriales bacterium]